MKLSALALAALAALVPAAALAQKASVEDTDKNFSEAPEAVTDSWIYNDLEKGFAEAKAAGKPLMVVYRCIP